LADSSLYYFTYKDIPPFSWEEKWRWGITSSQDWQEKENMIGHGILIGNLGDRWTTMIYAIAVLVIIMSFALLGEMLMAKKGDCALIVERDRIADCQAFEDETELTLFCAVPMVNRGKQQGLLIDCFSRLQPEGDKFKNHDIHCRIVNMLDPRRDDYWEATIIKTGSECPLGIYLRIRGTGNEREFIKSALETFYIDIHYKYYGRSLMAYEKCSLRLSFSSFKVAPGPLEIPVVVKEKRQVPTVTDSRVMPVKTHLLRPHEDIVEIIKKYTTGRAEKGDIIAIAESAVAIIQGRVYYAEEVKPRFLARKINRLFLKDSSLSSPYSLEMGFREVGVARILLATAAGILGKALGRSGDFYRVVGKGVATIDDCTGTLPPFDKYVVMGPVDLDKVTRTIKEGTGLEAAIVDANDLRKVDILASTCPQLASYLVASLIENPQGNANEQTPMVLIKAPSPGEGK
jgi:hypothetical protein